MAGSIKFKLVTAPYLKDSGAGVIDERQIWPNGGAGYEYVEADVGSEPPRITRFNSGVVSVPILRSGQARSFRTGPDEIGMVISSKRWSGSTLAQLFKLWQLGKPVAFTPWWDQFTVWCSTFGSLDPGCGVTEIGQNSAATIIPRAPGYDYYPSRFDKDDIGWIMPLGTTDLAKFVPGMIGNAILLESKTRNLMALNPTTSPFGAPILTSVNPGNTEVCTFKTVFMPSGNHLVTTFVSGLTIGVQYVQSIWARGAGTIALVLSGGSAGAYVTLSPGKYMRVWQQFTATATSHTLYITHDQGTSTGAMFSFGCWQLEAGDYPSSYMHPSANPSVPDVLNVASPIGRSPDLTIATWVRRTFDPVSNYRYLWSSSDVGVDYFSLIGPGPTLGTSMDGFIPTTYSIPAATNSWEQFVFTREYVGAPTYQVRFTVYRNGALLGAVNRPATASSLTKFPGMWIGSDYAITGPKYLGLQMPMDRFRIDSRAWTLQDVENDYVTFKDAGVRAFLSQTAGRLFQITTIPGSFGANVDPSAMMGSVQLEQVGTIPPAVPL